MFYTGNLSSGIEQLRTCNRCHRVFPVLSDLFNHMCDDEDDLLQTKSTISSLSSSSSSNKRTSDNLFNNYTKTTLNNNSLFDKKYPLNQDSSSSSSSSSFKLNRRSSFNDSSASSIRSKKLFSPPPISSPIIKNQTNLTSIHISPTNHLNNSKSSIDTTHIPLLKRPLFRPDSNHITRISSSSSPRTLFNDKPQHSSSAYVYLRTPSSPIRVIS